MSSDQFLPKQVAERWDEVFRALSAEPRRQVLLGLMEASSGDEIELPEAAVPPAVETDREALRTQLYHTHLPMLAQREYVEWSTDPFRARRGPAFGEVAVVLESIRQGAENLPDRLVSGCQRLAEVRDGDHVAE